MCQPPGDYVGNKESASSHAYNSANSDIQVKEWQLVFDRIEKALYAFKNLNRNQFKEQSSEALDFLNKALYLNDSFKARIRPLIQDLKKQTDLDKVCQCTINIVQLASALNPNFKLQTPESPASQLAGAPIPNHKPQAPEPPVSPLPKLSKNNEVRRWQLIEWQLIEALRLFNSPDHIKNHADLAQRILDQSSYRDSFKRKIGALIQEFKNQRDLENLRKCFENIVQTALRLNPAIGSPVAFEPVPALTSAPACEQIRIFQYSCNVNRTLPSELLENFTLSLTLPAAAVPPTFPKKIDDNEQEVWRWQFIAFYIEAALKSYQIPHLVKQHADTAQTILAKSSYDNIFKEKIGSLIHEFKNQRKLDNLIICFHNIVRTALSLNPSLEHKSEVPSTLECPIELTRPTTIDRFDEKEWR